MELFLDNLGESSDFQKLYIYCSYGIRKILPPDDRDYDQLSPFFNLGNSFDYSSNKTTNRDETS